jgi:hypothetical protein
MTRPATIPTPVLRLFGMLKEGEDSDGGWNGGDAVSALCEWFAALGLTPDAMPYDPQRCPACPAVFTEHDEDDDDDIAYRLGVHIQNTHTTRGARVTRLNPPVDLCKHIDRYRAHWGDDGEWTIVPGAEGDETLAATRDRLIGLHLAQIRHAHASIERLTALTATDIAAAATREG